MIRCSSGGLESGYEANATPGDAREKFIRVMVTIDAIDNSSQRLYLATFGAAAAFRVQAVQVTQRVPSPPTRPGLMPDAAMIRVLDKTQRVFISPSY
ncbi:MAG TPA: hypothetical protein DCE25_00140 [Pseudomonas sp.]|nr:hypothetical protein [Pseudomonas sp.]